MTNHNFSVTYYQTLTEVFWPLGSKKPNNDYRFQKFYKIRQILSKNSKIGNIMILQDTPLNLENIR